MPNTIDLQRQFISSLLTQNISDGVFIPHGDIKKRLEVYRRNFMQGHCSSLKKTFAITAKYLGDKFEALAISYICAHRPKASQLFATYGDTFAEFIPDPIAKELARLEWALQTIVMAPKDVSINIDFEMTPPDNILWQLRSDVLLLYSNYPICDLYFTLKNNTPTSDIEPKPSYYLLYRDTQLPIIFLLTAHEYSTLNYLSIPHTIDELFDRLTFSKDIFAKILENIFNDSFLRTAHVNDSDITEICATT